MLVNSRRGEAIPLDYLPNLVDEADAAGNLAQITLTIPAGSRLPSDLAVYVLLDVYPLHYEALGG